MPLATSRWIAIGYCWSIYSGVRQAVPELFPGGHISAGSEADANLRSFIDRTERVPSTHAPNEG